MTTSFLYSRFYTIYKKMNEIEEIVRDRIVIELENLKRDLKEEIKRLESESESSNIPSYSTYLQYLVEGIELAINKIEKRIQEKTMS